MESIAMVVDKMKMAQVQVSDSATPTPAPRLKTSDGCWPASPAWSGPRIDTRVHPHIENAVRAIVRLSQANAGAVMLAGHSGCGKTLLSEILLHSVGGSHIRYDHESGRSYWNAVSYAEPILLDTIRASYAYEDGFEQLVTKCANARLLILDDVGAGYVKEKTIDWYTSLLWRFLDNRRDKKTLLTTNLSPGQIKERLGFRSWSRMRELLSIDIERGSENFVTLFDVPDYRRRNW